MSPARGVLKPLRWPRLWLVLWSLAIVIVVVVCLIPPPPLALPPNSDKIEHLLAYFVLSASAVQLFRRGRPLLWAAVGLVALGIAIEVAQGALTVTRAADPWDALANTTGVLAGAAMSLTRWRDLLLRLHG